MIRGMEEYSTVEEGAVYKFHWIFPRNGSGKLGFGLNEDNRIIELSIEWPDGSETLLTDLNVNHHITIQRSDQ